MYFKKLKSRKASIVLSSVIIALTSITLSCFATTCENSIGVSNDVRAVTEQSTSTPSESSIDSLEEVTDNTDSKEILLEIPGNYRLIGAYSIDSSFAPQNENEIIVNTKDSISIIGPGKFNIVLDNVNIAIEELQDDSTCPFGIMDGAQVNLTLEGNNVLKSTLPDSYGLLVDDMSKLTITKSSEDSTLDIYGASCGIWGSNLIIKGGKIKANTISVMICSVDAMMDSEESGGVLTVEGGNIETSELTFDNLIINGGIIHSPEIRGDQIDITGGKIYTSNIRCNIEVTNGELITNYINSELYNNQYIRNLEKIFGTFNNDGELVACSTKQSNPSDRFIKYLGKTDVGALQSKYKYFKISGGSINGISFTINNDDSYALKDGNNFSSASNRNNYRDTLLFFSE